MKRQRGFQVKKNRLAELLQKRGFRPENEEGVSLISWGQRGKPKISHFLPWVTFHGSSFADHFWEPEGQLNRARKNQYLVPMPF